LLFKVVVFIDSFSQLPYDEALDLLMVTRRSSFLLTLLIGFFGSLGASPSTVLFTGNTASYLEPCGCVEGMLGGISRRARAMEDERDYILLDSGNFVDIKHELDRLRNVHYARSFKALGYHAIGIGSSEATQPLTFLMALDSSELFVSTNLATSASGLPPFARSRKIGSFHLLSLVSEFEGLHPDFKILPARQSVEPYSKETGIILLSNLNQEDLEQVIAVLGNSLVLVIANQAQSEVQKIDDIPIIYPGEKGKMIKKYDLSHNQYTSLAVLDSYVETPNLKSIVDGFYAAVEADPAYQIGFEPLFDDSPLEMQVVKGKNKFVGSENCKACHQPQYEQFKTTSHAHSFDSLLRKKRDFVPACVKCHAVGFGYPTGYEIAKRQKWLQQVGCESCHGPGFDHIRNPSSTTITRKVAKGRCLTCHDPENSPTFQFASSRPLVDHSILPQLVESLPPEKRSTVEMDLYVMSQCPFGIKAENKLLPLIKKHSDNVKLNIRFIATDVQGKVKKDSESSSEKTTEESKKRIKEKLLADQNSSNEGCKADFALDPNAKFQSLHGKSEVEEDILQVVVERLYPERTLDYILERNKNIHGDWRSTATILNLDPVKIKKAVDDGRGDRWFRENIAHANDLGISASPTLRINGSGYNLPLDAVPVQFELCQAMDIPSEFCKDVPICSQDAHCQKKGMNGFCKNPGQKKASCEFEEPVPVNLILIQDPDCSLCESGRFLQTLHRLFKRLSVTVLNRGDPRARELTTKLKTDRYPLYIFEDDGFRKSPSARHLQKYLAFYNEVYFINPLISDVASLNGPAKLFSLKLYTTAFSKSVGLQKDLIKIVSSLESQGQISVDLSFIPIVTQSRSPAPQPPKADERFKVMYQDGRGGSFPLYLESKNGRAEILENVNQLCISRLASKSQHRNYLSLISAELHSELGNARDQNDLSRKVKGLPIDKMRLSTFKKAGFPKSLQEQIAACVQGSDGARDLIMSMIDVVKKKIVVAPTLLINDYYMVRGVSPKLLESLPTLLKENKIPDKVLYGERP
jgi:predicted DsbA family dithiol-disulfide isomerase